MSDFQPKEWLDVADHLATPPAGSPAEASLRAAVNRYYYAALMAIARRVIDERGADPFVGRNDTHSRVKRGLATSGVPVLRELKDELRQLEHLRDRVDYSLGWECGQSEASEAKTRGDRLVAKIYRLRASYFSRLPV